MRLEGQTKLGYFPTPEQTLKYLITWLKFSASGHIRVLDPCCGRAEAIAEIADGDAIAFGLELSTPRADAAEDAIPHVLNTAYEYAVLTPETFSLILLNPPYDGESTTGGGKRMEETFLCDLPTTEVLVSGGVLLYLIPHSRINERIARHLTGWYTNLQCLQFPAGEYEAFKQVAIFAVKKPDYTMPDSETLKRVLAWQTGQQIVGWTTQEMLEADTGKVKKTRVPNLAPLSVLTTGHGEYVVPETPLKGKGGRPFRFQYNAVSDENFQREAEECGRRLDASREWQDLIPALAPPVIEPAMTPKKGHIAMQVTGGLLGTNRVLDSSGRTLLLKGNVDKVVIQKQGDVEEEVEWRDIEDDKEKLRKVELEERFRALLTTLDEDGELVVHADSTDIAPLLEKYVGQLAEVVQARNIPQYDMQPEAWEWAVFEPLSRARTLPGRAETGLTDFQKHLAIALGRLCCKHGAGFINAEMGSGKTTIGLAIAEYLRSNDEQRHRPPTAYPALVVGPGIVTGKENWPKEIPEVIPGAQGYVVAVGAKPLPKPAKIGAYLREHLGLLVDEGEFEGKSATWALNTIRRAAKKQKVTLNDEHISALKESLERAAQHLPARRRGAKKLSLLDGRIGGYHWLGLAITRDENSENDLRGKYSLAQFIAEYRAGMLPSKSFAIVSYETAKLGSGRVPAMATRHIRVRWVDEEGERHSALREVCACPTCGAVVSKDYDEETDAPLSPFAPAQAEEFIGLKRRYCQAPTSRRVWEADKGKHITQTHDEEGSRLVCGAPLFENSSLRRIPAAEYARKKAKGVFGLCLVDEAHKAKSKGTGVGQALMSLVNSARYTVGLTGTLLNGYSTSIFWLFYRLCGEVRQGFRFNDERRWVEKFGLLKRTFYTDSDAPVADDGAFTGTKYFETVSERPGISPAIAGLGLKYCTFSSLQDVGLPLPPYSEEIVRLTLTEAMREQYALADGSGAPPRGLFAWAMQTQKEETGRGAISVWLNTALNRADAMFRSESVFFNRRLFGRGRFAQRQSELVKTFEPVVGPGEWLPKETWAAERALAEYRAGRKALIYVRQTGERDIQPRLQECLMAHGLRVGILRPSLAPEKRATWIKRHVTEFDVLLTNARLVEVGLNLVMFSTGIFYELEWSLSVVWQAMRRLYRPGAPKPVKLYFPVYAGTLEEAALDLLGAKMLAATVFYGDEASGALIDEEDGAQANLLNDLVRRAMGELQVGRAEGLFALAQASNGSAEDSGSAMFVATPPTTTMTLAELWAQRPKLPAVKPALRRLAPEQADNQMSLF